ncbi:hypothetical protein FRC12_012034 [Ceratobasidium sp. 428]|nr:hypothetical protein FRC12_012034 [Ceratobasidium sp. 428]
MQLPLAETVLANMRKGWTKHIALTMLDDEYCEKVARGHVTSRSVGFNDKGGVHIVETDVKDLSRDEHSISFAQWDQAVPRLLNLIKQFLRDPTTNDGVNTSSSSEVSPPSIPNGSSG